MTPGIKTTEFWICLLASAAIGGLGYLQEIGVPWAVTALTVIATAYAAFRSALKSKAAGK